MKTKAVRLYGAMDLRLEEFELPPIREDEILARVISDSICMSTYKAAVQGANHKRVPADVAEHPVIIGHEFCGELVEIGAKWKDQFRAGDRFVIQPAINYRGSLASPGYSYPYIGGDATYVVIPHEVMELGCLLPYNGDAFFHANYHTKLGSYVHTMEPVPHGTMAILAGAGPMGLGCADYALHGLKEPPRLLVVTDLDDARLARAARLLPPERRPRRARSSSSSTPAPSRTRPNTCAASPAARASTTSSSTRRSARSLRWATRCSRATAA